MIHFLKSCIGTLDAHDRRSLLFISALGVIAAFLEIGSVFSIVPTIQVIVDKEVAEKYIYFLEHYLGIELELVLVHFAMVSIAFIVLGVTANVVYTYMLARFEKKIFAKTSTRKMSFMLNLGLDRFSEMTSSEFAIEVNRAGNLVSTKVVAPIVTVVSRSTLVLLVMVALVLVDLTAALIISSVLTIAYLAIHKFANAFIISTSHSLQKKQKGSHRILSDTYANYLPMYIHRTKKIAVEKYYENKHSIGRQEANIDIIGALPRHLIEGLGIVLILCIAIYLYGRTAKQEVIAGLAVYVLSAYRVLPAFQQIYNAMNKLSTAKAMKKSFLTSSDVKLQGSGKCKTRIDNNLVIRMLDVSYGYEPSRLLLNKLNLEISEPGVYLLCGKSGSGKTTVFELILGLKSGYDGKITVSGFEVSDLDKPWHDSVSIVPQDPVFWGENLGEVFLVGSGKKITDAEFLFLIERLGLAETFARNEIDLSAPRIKLEQLSGGERSRLALAIALHRKPSYLFLDEPFSALDIGSAKRLSNEILELIPSSIILAITHRPEEVSRVNRVFNLDSAL